MTYSVVARPRIRRSPALMGTVGAIALVAAIANGGALVAFPSAAPVESIYNVGLTIDLIVIALVLIAATVVTTLRSRATADLPEPSQIVLRRDGAPQSDELPPRAPVLATLGLVFIAATWVAFVAFSLTSVAYAMLAGARFQYMSAIGAIFYFGVLWVLGVIFGTLGFHRRGDGRNRLYASLAVGFGMLLTVPVVGFALVYALGLSD